MKLSEFFGRYFTPVYLARAKKRTVDLYRHVVDLWISELDDLEISQISLQDCTDFVTWSLGRVCPDTVAKYCRLMNTIFLKMAKRDYRNRQAFGFIESPLYCAPPILMQRLPKQVSDRQLCKLIEALGINAEYPKHLEEKFRPKWWKSLCLFAATTAVRRGVIFGLKWEHFDLTRNVFYVPPELDKVNKERIKYLHSKLVRLLLQIRTAIP
jgi:integrase